MLLQSVGMGRCSRGVATHSDVHFLQAYWQHMSESGGIRCPTTSMTRLVALFCSMSCVVWVAWCSSGIEELHVRSRQICSLCKAKKLRDASSIRATLRHRLKTEAGSGLGGQAAWELPFVFGTTKFYFTFITFITFFWHVLDRFRLSWIQKMWDMGQQAMVNTFLGMCRRESQELRFTPVDKTNAVWLNIKGCLTQEKIRRSPGVVQNQFNSLCCWWLLMAVVSPWNFVFPGAPCRSSKVVTGSKPQTSLWRNW